MKVLVVEDAELLRDRLVELVCEVPGVSLVATAEDAQSGVAACVRVEPDVAILDLHLPDGTALDILQRLSALNQRPLVMVLDGQAPDSARARCFAAGAQHFFNKTTEFGKIATVLRAAIGAVVTSAPPTLLPPDEPQRLQALHAYDVLDTPPEPQFDDLARLAAMVCSAPIALLTLVDAERQWFKARIGLAARQSARNLSFCQHTVMRDALLVVGDTAADRRFADNPLVRDAPRVRFYAGAPLRAPGGHAVGVLCVMDTVPRDLTATQEEALEVLAEHAVTHLELRRRLLRLQHEVAERARQAESFEPHAGPGTPPHDTGASSSRRGIDQAEAQGRDASHSIAAAPGTQESAGLDGDMHGALERDEFVLHYQPRFAVRGGHLTGVEALVRWRHPQLGLLAPQRFIALAEESGLIVQLGKRVIDLACEQSSLWAASGWTPPRISVNVSGAQFRNGLLAAVTGALERNRVPGSALELDIAETVLLREVASVRRTLEPLGRMGLRVAIGDFGTGYSALRLLKELPVHTLKVDRSIIGALPGDTETIALVRAVIAMAHSLGIEVGAEGVERAEQLAALAALECDTYQGRYACEPVPAEELAARFAHSGNHG